MSRLKRNHPVVVKGREIADLDSSSFDPKAYINAHMNDKNINGLVEEKRIVQLEQRKQAAGMKQTVAKHLTTFISCKDTIQELQNDAMLLDQQIFHEFKSLQQTVSLQCGVAFDSMLDNDDSLSKNKKVNQIFDKLHDYLSLPECIQNNIDQKKYTQVVFDYRRSKHFEAVQGVDSKQFFQGVFTQINTSISKLRTDLLSQIRELPTSMDTSKAHQILQVLKDLDTRDLASEYCSLIEGKVISSLSQAADSLRGLIEQKRIAASRVQDQVAWKLTTGSHQLKTKTSEMGNLDASVDTLRSLSTHDLRTRMFDSVHRLKSFKSRTSMLTTVHSTVEDDPSGHNMSFHKYSSAVQLNTNVDSISALTSELCHISASCAITETLSFIEECGEMIIKQLLPFWQVYQRLWIPDGEDVEEDSLPEKVFTKSILTFEKYVWPCITAIQPAGTSTVTLQQWRAALLSVVKPLHGICSSAPESLAGSAKDFKDVCQSHFVEQSAGRLTNEIASWADAVEWEVSYRVSRKYPSTILPLWFETAIIDLVTLWTSSDDLRPDSEQFDVLHDRILEAHKDFIDLLHHVAFSQNNTKSRTTEDRNEHSAKPGGSEKKNFSSALAVFLGESRKPSKFTDEQRFKIKPLNSNLYTTYNKNSHLMIWSDCNVLLKVVCKNTFTAFHKMMGDADDDVIDLVSTANGTTRIPSFDSPLASPRKRPDEMTDFQALKNIINALQSKLTRTIATGRMDSMCTNLCLTGFIRCNINWAFAAEPKRIRSYCHTLLLSLVELHEATVRLTRGFATRDVLRVTMETLMAVFLYSVRHLDFFDASPLCSANATLQLELEMEFLSQCISGFKTSKSQMYQNLSREYLMQFYVNTNEEAERRRKIRNKVLLDFQRSKVLIDALKHDPTPTGD